MNKKVVGLAAAALTGLFVLSTGVEPAVAAHGGGGGNHGGGGGHSSIGGVGRSFAGTALGRSATGTRVYGYQARAHHGHGRRIIPVPYGYYYGGTCANDYNRAVATGSAYWWNRYEECID